MPRRTLSTGVGAWGARPARQCGMRWEDLVWTRERAEREGVSRARLTGGTEFVRVVRGRYLEAGWARDVRARSAAALSLFPRACMSHWTALELAGLPVPAHGRDLRPCTCW